MLVRRRGFQPIDSRTERNEWRCPINSVTQSRLAVLLIGALSVLVMPMVHAAGEGDHGHAGGAQKMQMSKADSPRIDAHTMAPEMNIFEFGARMWNHSQVMTAVQIAAMGQQIKLTGEELGHITAFVHDDQTQHTVKNADIPHHIREKMHHEHDTGKDTH